MNRTQLVSPLRSRSLFALVLAAVLSACGSSQTPAAAPPAPAVPRDGDGGPGAAHHHQAEAHAGPDGEHHHGKADGKVEPLGHRFERADEWVERFEGADRDAWQKPGHVLQVAGIGDHMVVADLGAGTGYFLPHLASAVKLGGRVIALDVEPDMVRYLGERIEREQLLNVEARVVKVDDPGLAAQEVDRVLIVDTWHHIPNRAAYAKKLASALRAKGGVVIVDFTMESPHGPPQAHRTPVEQVVGELEAAGLRAEILGEELPYQYVVVGWRR